MLSHSSIDRVGGDRRLVDNLSAVSKLERGCAISGRPDIALSDSPGARYRHLRLTRRLPYIADDRLTLRSAVYLAATVGPPATLRLPQSAVVSHPFSSQWVHIWHFELVFLAYHRYRQLCRPHRHAAYRYFAERRGRNELTGFSTYLLLSL